jgi:hypothetical protein
VFLKWIDDQYPAIAAECGYPADGTVNGVPALNLFFEVKDASTSQKLCPPLRQGKRTRTRSILSPNSASRISKPSRNKSDCRHKVQLLSSDIPPPTTIQHHPVEWPIPPRRSERLRQSKTSRPAQGPKMSGLILWCPGCSPKLIRDS